MHDNPIKVLDCTFRDGGYYTDWKFDKTIVSRYFNSLKESKIDIIELGFRFLKKNSFYGDFAFTDDKFLSSLDLPDNIDFAVMINAKEFLEDKNSISTNISNTFNKKTESKISIVRIAINFNNFEDTKPIVEDLKKLGYKVGLNLMQAHNKSAKDYQSIGSTIDSWGVDVLYFADSLGSMDPEVVSFIAKNISRNWKGELGFHAHNNKGHALVNTITAVNEGVTWVDGTITGMGRGAGNTSTESLILELKRLKFYNGNPLKIQPTVSDFSILKNKFDWGPNFYYHFAANNNIHPTYVQSLFEDKRYTKNRILKSLELLTSIDASSFSRERIRNAVYSNSTPGSWNAFNWLEDENVLIVGAGPSVKRYKDEIKKFIKLKKPKVLFLNTNKFINQSYGFATIVCHERRALIEVDEYEKLNHPLIMPINSLNKILKERLKNLDVLDYGLNLENDKFEISDKYCTLHSPLAISYAISLATIGNANNIFLVGFDGYTNNQPKQDEMDKMFKRYKKLSNKLEIISLTPTSYKIVFQNLIDI